MSHAREARERHEEKLRAIEAAEMLKELEGGGAVNPLNKGGKGKDIIRGMSVRLSEQAQENAAKAKELDALKQLLAEQAQRSAAMAAGITLNARVAVPMKKAKETFTPTSSK